MFGIGIIEIFVVLMVSLFVIGPDKLPEAARAVGRFFHSIKQYANEIKRSVAEHDVVQSLQEQDSFDIPELMPDNNEDEPMMTELDADIKGDSKSVKDHPSKGKGK